MLSDDNRQTISTHPTNIAGFSVPYLLSGGSLLVPADPSLAYSSFHCTAKNRHGEVRGPSILLKPAFLDSFRTHRGSVVPLYNGGAKLECDAPNHQPNLRATYQATAALDVEANVPGLAAGPPRFLHGTEINSSTL
nr:Protein RIG-6, isoform d [Haemonchus contortus]